MASWKMNMSGMIEDMSIVLISNWAPVNYNNLVTGTLSISNGPAIAALIAQKWMLLVWRTVSAVHINT